MIGDIIIIEKHHILKSHILAPEIVKSYFPGKKMIVALGGEPGVGKTEIATLLQKKLWNDSKIRSKKIHLDDYYFTSWQERNKLRKAKGIKTVGIKEIQWNYINRIIKTFLLNHGNLHLQKIHMYTNSIEKTISNTNFIDILLIEGLYANYIKNKSLGIYLEGTVNDTENFRIKRNKEPQNNFRNRVLKKEHQEVLKTKENADIYMKYNIKNKKELIFNKEKDK